MMRASRIVSALLVVAAICARNPLSAQQQTRDQPAKPQPGPTGTGVLSGVVTSEDGGRPVRNAYLVLLGIGTGTVKVSSSDADGRFTFASLPADRYTIGASKPPYLGTVAGARRPGRTGTPIAVADGQKIANVAIRMPMGASISGAITDEKGQPASGAVVSVQMLRMQNGERTLVPPPSGTVRTDERGRYRAYGLLPGDYVIAAMGSGILSARPLTVTEVDNALRGAAPAAPNTAQPPLIGRLAPVYFPGTTRASDAVPVTIGSGEDRVNVDFRLETVKTAKVEGVVAGSNAAELRDANGQALVGSVMIVTAANNPSPMRIARSARILPDGRFSFSDVTPGTYNLSSSSQASGPSGPQYAFATVEVNGVDVLGVQLVMRPLLSTAGRIEFRGAGTSPALAGRRIPMRAIGASVFTLTPNVTATTAAGAFTITNIVPGAYLIGAPLSFGPTTDSMTWALESVTADGVDITDRPIDITPDKPPKEIVVTYSDRYQELSGKLSRADGSPVSEYTIVVFPEDRTMWVNGSRRIVTTRPGTDGRFTLSGAGPTTLPAGKYYLAAVTDIDRNEQFDPAFLASIVPAAAQITLQPGEKKVQDLIVK